MGERGANHRDRHGRDRRDRLAPGSARRRSAAATSAGRRPHATSAELVPGAAPAPRAAARDREARSVERPAREPQEAPGANAPAAGANAPTPSRGPSPAPVALAASANTGVHGAAGLLLRPAPAFRRVPDRALGADLGQRALRPDVRHLLVHPVAWIPLGDDLHEA